MADEVLATDLGGTRDRKLQATTVTISNVCREIT